MIKRALAATLCLMLVFALLPQTARADGAVEQTVLDIREGSIEIGDGTVSGYGAGGSPVTIHDSDGYEIIGGDRTSNTITVTGGTHEITLNTVRIATRGCAFAISSGADVTLKLVGDNTLISRLDFAGLHVPTDAAVTITGSGSLTVAGGSNGAGIGGNSNGGCGIVDIRGGTLAVTGGYYGAGIGGGFYGSGGTVYINGGTVTATGGTNGAGIGGGHKGAGGTVNINGGTVTATGGDEGAGIGSGYDNSLSDSNTVNITGGTVTANGRYGGAGIGGGLYDSSVTVKISGGNIKAAGSVSPYDGTGADIGAGAASSSGSTPTDDTGTNDVYRITLTLDGDTPIGELTTADISSAYGMADVKPLDGNMLYFYLPEGTEVNSVTTGDTPPRLFTNQTGTDITVRIDQGNTGTLTEVATATISNVTVSGTTGTAISASVTVTLTKEKFLRLSENTDISDWFENLPEGLAAVLSDPPAENDTTFAATISGTPTAASTETIALTIPGICLIGENADIIATENDNARWAITSSAPLQIICGQNGKWAKGSTTGLSFTSNGEYRWFDGVLVDGTTVSSGNYTAESGSTIVTLKAAYLKTLSVGRHTLRINYRDGYAGTDFFILSGADVPETGDSSQPLLWLGLMLLAGAGLAASAVRRRRRQNG